MVTAVVLCTLLAFYSASASPLDFLIHQKLDKPSQPLFSQPSSNYDEVDIPEDRPKNCFHFFVSRNMSSLLADATKMLRTVRSQQEREWLLTFIYRIKSLAEHLRAHPESRNYYCLPTDDETKRRALSDVKGQQQPELYFIDEVVKKSDGDAQPDGKYNQASSKEQSVTETRPRQGDKEVVQDLSSPPEILHVSVSTTEASPISPTEDARKVAPTKTGDDANQHEEATQAMDKKSDGKDPSHEAVGDIVLSAAPDCDKTPECQRDRVLPEDTPGRFFADAGDIDPLYLAEKFNRGDIERYEQERLKRRIRKALLEELAPEVRKLKTVGGTPEDLMYLWNGYISPEDNLPEDTETDFDYEDNGAAVGDLNMNEKTQPDRTVAPSLDEVQNTKESAYVLKDASYEPYDDSDVLVQQLFDARFGEQQSKTTKSLGDQSNNNNDYIITSTNTPF